MTQREADAVLDAVADRLELWRDGERARLTAMLKYAGSDVKRELIRRAVAAGQSAIALQEFADALRPLSDSEAVAAVTIIPSDESTPAQALALQADPLSALKSMRKLPMAPAGSVGNAPPRYDYTRAPSVRDLGHSGRAAPARTGKAAAPDSQSVSDLAERLGLAMEPMAVRYEPQSTRADDGGSLADAVDRAAVALKKGWTVPFVVQDGGREEWALAVQMLGSRGQRAFYFLNVRTGAHAWAHERDLLMRGEVPLAGWEGRRIVRVLVPEEST